MTAPLTPDIARANPNRTLGILVLGAISYALAQTMIIPALPAIQHDLGASQEAVTWLLTAFLLDVERLHAAARPPRRHVRQGEGAAGCARRLRVRLVDLRDRRFASAC